MTGKEGVISAFLTGFIFVVLWLTVCENLPYNEGKIQSIRLERRRKMKKAFTDSADAAALYRMCS